MRTHDETPNITDNAIIPTIAGCATAAFAVALFVAFAIGGIFVFVSVLRALGVQV